MKNESSDVWNRVLMSVSYFTNIQFKFPWQVPHFQLKVELMSSNGNETADDASVSDLI